MQSLLDQEASGVDRRYVHWRPEHSPYAVELKATALGRLVEAISAVQERGIEIGGVLVGSFPKAAVPTIRIEDFIPVSRDVEDGAEYLLTPQQREAFTEARREANTRETSPIGFFRSHLRPGPLSLSAADLALISEHFHRSIHLALLVRAEEPRLAALFLSMNGEMGEDTLVPEFSIDADGLASLMVTHPSAVLARPALPHTTAPKQPALGSGSASALVRTEGPIEVGYPESLRSSRVATTKRRPAAWFWALTFVLVLLSIAAGLVLRPLIPGTPLERLAPASPNHLNLEVVESGPVLRISWNHAAPDLYEAQSALLAISDGSSQRQIKLEGDELRSGLIEYRRNGQQVLVTLALSMPGATTLSQSVFWHAQ